MRLQATGNTKTEFILSPAVRIQLLERLRAQCVLDDNYRLQNGDVQHHAHQPLADFTSPPKFPDVSSLLGIERRHMPKDAQPLFLQDDLIVSSPGKQHVSRPKTRPGSQEPESETCITS